MKKRIGNDITFTWHIYRKDGETQTPESFDGKDVEVKLISPLQRPVTIEDVSIATGVVTFTFRGKHQVTLGNYVAVLQENKGDDGMVTLDVVDAVTLVPHSYMEEDGDEGDAIEAEAVELTSTISAGGGGGIEQQQADWAQTDASAVDYIKNKPDLEEYAMLHNPNRFTETQVIEDERYRATFTQQYIELRDKAIPSNPTLRIAINGIFKIPNTGTINDVVWEDTATSQIPAATTSTNGLMSAEDKGKLNDLPTDAELTQELAGKQDTINDLAAIRSGAQVGATAYQKPSTGIPATDLASDVQTDLAAIDTIEEVIPAQATSSNQLADKDFVNSSIATATATYRGSYNLVSDLLLSVSATQQQIVTALATKMAALSIVPDNNDYCFVQIPTADATPTEIARVDRYKYDGTAWVYEYSLNNSGFTAAQWAAINSNITSGLVTKLSALPTNSELTTLLSGKASTADLAEVATTGSYNSLRDKPTIQDLAALKYLYALDNTNPDYPSMRGSYVQFNKTCDFGAISIVNVTPGGVEVGFTNVVAQSIEVADYTIDGTLYTSYLYNSKYYLGVRVPFFTANVAQYGNDNTLGVIKFTSTQKGVFKVHSIGLEPRYCTITINGETVSSLDSDVVKVNVNIGDVVKIISALTTSTYVRVVGFVFEGSCGVSMFNNDAGYVKANELAKKADKVSTATNGNFAALDSNGNLIDSGHKHSDYLTQHQDLTNYVQKSQTAGLLKNDGTVDTTQYLTQHQDISGKADKSEMGVEPGTGANADKTTITLKQGTSATVLTAHQDITGKEDITPIVAVASGTTAINAAVNAYYEVAGTVSSLTVTLPTPTANTEVTMVVVHLTVGASPTILVTSVNEVVKFSAAYSVVANKEYELSCLYNGSKWIVSSMEVAV